MRRIDVHELADHARFTALPTVVAIMASALVDHSRSASAHHVNVGATIAEPEFEAGEPRRAAHGNPTRSET